MTTVIGHPARKVVSCDNLQPSKCQRIAGKNSPSIQQSLRLTGDFPTRVHGRTHSQGTPLHGNLNCRAVRGQGRGRNFWVYRSPDSRNERTRTILELLTTRNSDGSHPLRCSSPNTATESSCSPTRWTVSASMLVGDFAQHRVIVGRAVMRDRPPVHRLRCEMGVPKGIVDRRNSGLAEVAGPRLLRRNRVQRRLIYQDMLSNTPFPRRQQNALFTWRTSPSCAFTCGIS